MTEPKFKVGQKVRIKKDGTGDSDVVAGRVGEITSINSDDSYATVYFKGWDGGWYDGRRSGKPEKPSFWGVASENFVPVKKARRVKRVRRTKKA